MEDGLIIALYWERNEEAIAQSNLKYGGFLRKLAFNILSSHEDSEECINDTWHRAWNTMPPKKPDSLRAYLGRIVRNLSISRFRMNRAKKRFDGMTELMSELGDCIPSGQNVEQAVEVKELAKLINSWLDGLTVQERVLFLRRYWNGDAVKDLAAECSVTPGKMAQKLYRLRNSLRTALEQEGITL
ncbi:sigma-70 family RNA polymerase sigma factor [Anaerolentibacter hominis]|uniref:RNA polymerase sigma factor n=1 Tax=Anaerolentibacter hominis TaxID=3079009 RepID=UPI0031B87B60